MASERCKTTLGDGGEVNVPEFAEQACQALKTQELSQKWLSETIGLDKGTVSRMLRGHRVGTVENWVKIANALGYEWVLRQVSDHT